MISALKEQRNRAATAIESRLKVVAATVPPPVFLSVEKAIALSVPMQAAICASAAFHILLVLGLGFASIDPRRLAPPHNIMDVVLVNAKTKDRPKNADALAQANLDGGGNTDEKRRAKTPLPAVEQSSQKNDVKAQLERVKQLEQEMKTLMTQAKSVAKVVQGEVAQEPAGAVSTGSAADLMQKSIEIAKLEAQISKEYDAYQQRPKRKFIGARTSEYRFATYVDSWRSKVERVGNLNYPAQARERKIYGSLQLTVAIKADGEVEDIQINRSSGHKVLDEAAKRIVRLSAPFERFSDNIKRDTDILHITRTWVFERGDTLTSQ